MSYSQPFVCIDLILNCGTLGEGSKAQKCINFLCHKFESHKFNDDAWEQQIYLLSERS